MPDRSHTPSSLLTVLSTLLLLVCSMSLPGTAVAQSNRYSGQAFEPLTNTYFHLQYEGGDDWAQGTQQAQFGGTRYVDALNGNGLWLNYGQFGFDHNGHHSLNAGVVRRFWLGGGIIGLGGHYDLTRSALGNDFQKAAVTGEWFSSDSNWIVRGEGNFAVGPDSFLIQDLGNTIDEVFFQGNNLMIGQSAGQLREEGMSGLEYELARSLGNYAAEGYLGGYHYLGQVGDDANGIKGGVRGFVSPGVFANLEVREDNVFGTSLYGGVTLFLGGPSRSQTQTLADQMIMPVQRHNQAIVNTVDTRVVLPDLAVTQGGNVVTFTHIDNVNTGDGGNAGTYEDPFTSLVAANGSSNDIVYVHSGTTYTNDGYEMSENQRFLGEGGGNQHQLMTDQLGLINLPEVNGIGGARPVIRGGTTPITVAGNSEISNFDIEQASRTLMFNNVAGNVDVNRLTGSGAIYIDGGSGDYTFSDVHIVDSSNGGLFINGGSSNVTFEGIYGGSSLSVLDGYAVAIQDNHSGTVLFPTSSSITTTNAQGFSFLNGLSGTYVFNGTNSILNSSGNALNLANSGGTYVFGENTSITNSGDSAVSLDLAGVNDIGFVYGGTILNNNGHAIQVSGGTGTQLQVAFGSSAEDAIQDNADGISITDTDADVALNSDTELTGSNGIYIGDSNGTYTFGDTDIELSSGTGAAMRISGGSSTVNFGDDSLLLNTILDREVLRVENGHTGTLNMDGTVGAAAGDGIVFNNADGTYNFTGTTVLNGSTRGIDIGNGSSGTFAFSSTTAIANTTDEAIRMDLANADNLDFTYSGLIQNLTGRAIDISGGPGTGQSVVFNSAEVDAILDGGEGIRIANTDADVNIQADTELTGSNGIEITNSTGTYTFADTDIALSSGSDPSLSISGGSSDVNFGANSSITNDQNRSVVSVEDGHTGTLTMDGNISSTAGDGIVFDNADGTYNFNGTTSLNGTTRGIDVANGSAGTFAFSENTSIVNTTDEAVRMDLTGADNLDFTYSGAIQNSTGRAISISGSGAGQSVLFNSTATDAIQDSGQGIWIADTGTDVDIQADTELTGSNGITITDSTGTYTFADTDIALSSGSDPSLSISGGSSNVNFGANSSITNDQNRSVVSVENGHTGTLTMGGMISSTAGDSLVFDDADGTYNFTGTTTINGANRGIQISNGSEGIFSFSENTSIANVDNIAVQMDLTGTTNFDFTYSGTIQNSISRMIDIDGGSSGQSIVFNSTAADALQDTGDGIWISNTSADVDLLADTELTGNFGVILEQANGTYTFADTDITDLNPGPFGNQALWIRGGSGTVNFGADSSITTDVGGNLVMVEQGHSGTLNMNGDLASTVGGGVLFNDADGTYNFNGVTTLDGTDNGIRIVNSSEGTFAFSEDTSISNTTNDAIEMTLVGVNTFDFTYSGTILNTTGRAIDINGGPAAGQSILFNSTAVDAIQDSGDGIWIGDTAANVDIQADTELTGSSGITIEDAAGTYTFADTDINLSSGTDPSLSIDGGSSNVNFGANSSITNDQNRSVVSVEDGHTGTLTMDGNISSTAGDGIVFDNANGTYNFNGTTSLNGTTRGIDVANGSSGTFAFSENTSIVNTTDEAVRMDLAGADNLDFTYSGTIQNSTGRAIDISGSGAGQSVLFNSTATDAIQDSGQGIWIADTGTDVDIQADTELTGSNGVTITDSAGTYTFADTDINLSSGTDPSLSISGGSSNVNFGANSSITNDQNRSVVSVENGHTGTLTMDGNISSTAGDGIVFDNADGTYNFNGTTTLNGTTRGIDVANGSSGTFAFSENTSIVNTTDEAVRMDLAGADNLDFTYSGTIQNSTGRAISISGGPGTGQTVLFNSTAADAIQDSGSGILIAGTDADVNIQAETELTGSSGIIIAGANGDYTFADTDINLSSGAIAPLLIDGGAGNVLFGTDSSITNTQDRIALMVQGGHTGTLTMDGSISSTDGAGLAFNNADGTYNFNGTTTLDGTDRGIRVYNGSAGTFTFSEDTSIANTLNEAVQMDLANADNLDFTYSGTIQNSTGRAIDISGGPGTGQSVLFNSTATDAIQDSGTGISIADTDADVNIQADTELTGSNGITITDSTGTYTFADTDVDLSSGTDPSLSISGGSSNINFGANSSITNDQNRSVVSVENGHTGTLTMDGNISSTAGDGMVFNNADGTYNFNGTTSLNGTSRGIDILNGSAGTFAFSENTSIVNATNEAIRMDLANADNFDFTYSGTIQNSTGRAIDISGGPGTGQSVLFNSAATDAIQDSGTGISIADTDADVDIQADTELTGSNGITITDSTGTYTFADTDVDLSSGTDPSLSISGGSSNVNFGANSSITNDQNRSVVSVENGHTGTLTMDGNISSTAGDGIVFDNADGTYNFNGTTSLNGTTRGIDIANGSAGTFAFSENTSIVNATNEAIRMDLANADNFDFTYSGTIQNSTGRAIDISGGPGTGQSVLFNSAATDAIQDSGQGIWISGTDADVNIQSDTELTGSNGIEITNSTGTYTFADTDINLSSGTDPSLSIDGGSSTVNFGANSSITNNQNRSVVSVENGHTGTLNMDGNISSTAGDGLVFNNADGTYNFNGTTSLNGTSNGVQITNGSSGTFAFSANTSITDTTGVAYTEANSTADVTYNGTITQNNAASAVSITDKTSGTTTFNGQVTANTGSSTAVNLNNNAGSTTTFNGGLDIDTTTGDGLYANNAGTVNITGAGNSIYTTDGRGVYIADTTAGMLFNEITVLQNSIGADAITLRNMSGSFAVTGTTSIGSAGTVGNGINISSGTTTQTGTIAFGDVNLGAAGLGGSGYGISVDGSNQAISFSNTSISGGWNRYDVRYRSTGSAGSLTFDELNNTSSTTLFGMSVQNSDGSVAVNAGTISGNSAAALEVDRGTGAVSIMADLVDLSGGGNVVSLSGRGPTSGDINISGDVTSNGSGILVDTNTGGTINFSGDVNMTGLNGLFVDSNSGTTINFTGSDTVFDTLLDSVAFVNNASTSSLNFSSGNLDIDSALASGIYATGAGSLSILGTGNTIDAFNDDAIYLDGVTFSLNNTWVSNSGAFYTISTGNSVLSGSGNIAPIFQSNDRGGNAGVIEFNGGLDLAP